MISIQTIFHRFKEKKFYKTNLKNVEFINIEPSQHDIHVITITYNNSKLLQFQIDLMKKNICDNFKFIVADNSSLPSIRKEIITICKNNNIGYISLPLNPFEKSASHAASLNWVYKNYISVVKPTYFGFIDHDAFPIKNHSIIQYMSNQPIYGHLQTREHYWYLWAGLCFFKNNYLINKNINFFPCKINDVALDTGGGNWNSIYKELQRDAIKFPSLEYISIREGGHSVQADKVEIIGDWLHTFNGSYWMEMEAKENHIEEFLKSYY